ncbi:unnamed protein product [Ambrosiozyma monospora]|uniref:Dolichol-phosphate mannosyltransferase subunit 3 n=1 Tax=Ambrosiozyma monospora TaxID=43982 RepID=A0A9W7DEM7_AMBMO|nr:unnamed protein product [Ambrosiozyma monospora]
MTKAAETVLTLFTLSAIYFALLFGIIPTSELIQNEILPVVPWWALVSFGAYALGSLGLGVFTFKDKEDKYKELLLEIDEAKAYLSKNGVDVE